mmetsp:Transcript_5313/g.9758  ORF Transcript_5313/g.9758 Transcript_5313/m.9758 type:complete len:206 (+) Transcript_5313:189-806(+)
MCLCASNRQKRLALLLGYGAITLVSIGVIISCIATAANPNIRSAYKFQLFWNAGMTLFSILMVIHWRVCRPASNMHLSAAVVTLFMMALQSVATSASAFAWEGNPIDDPGTSFINWGQGWVGVLSMVYTAVAAFHLSMMCAWRDVDIDAYEAVPMRMMSGGMSDSSAKTTHKQTALGNLRADSDTGLSRAARGRYGSGDFHSTTL